VIFKNDPGQLYEIGRFDAFSAAMNAQK